MSGDQSRAAPLAALEDHGAFVARHVGPRADAQAAMLRDLGFASRAALMKAIVPAAIRDAAPLPLPPPWSENQAQTKRRRQAGKKPGIK